MPRIIAIDYGKKRTGIAVTDNLQIIAYGLKTVKTDVLLDFLKKYCSEQEVEKVVFGKPIRSDGSVGQIFTDIQAVAKKIVKICPTVEIIFINEAYTSKQAVKEMRKGGMKKKKRQKKENLDKISAALILQEYLREIGKY